MANADDLEQKLTCSICLQLFREPRLLPCGHTFCQNCLCSHIISKPPVPSLRGQQGFQCPVCREFVAAPDRVAPPQLWACKFKPNFLIRDIVEAHGKNKQRSQRPPCPRHPNKALELYCRDCRTSACDRCVALSHRKCEDVLELVELSRESQQSARRHQQTVNRLLKQLEAKKRRCITGRRELERIERDMDAKIEREGQELLRKVADFLRGRKEALKRQAHAHCRQCVNVVNAYTEKCEELSGALRALDRVLGNKLRPDRPLNKVVNQQEEFKLNGMVQKLESAVQQLDSPCHFTVRLIMDDTALTTILATLKLGEIRTGENGVDTLGRIAASSASDSAASQELFHGVGYQSGCSVPERPSSAVAAWPSSSASSINSSSCSPVAFCHSSSSLSSPPVTNNLHQPSMRFSSLGGRVFSDSRLSVEDGRKSDQGIGSSHQGESQVQGQHQRSASRLPFNALESPPPVPLRRKLSQP